MDKHTGPDAVIIGAGHNGLIAAILLADAGYDVLVLEATDRVGGAVFSDRSLHRDFVTDWFSAFYPLAASSPVMTALDLDACGLRWTHAPAVLAHVLPDDRCALLSRDVEVTRASLEQFGAGDGVAWARMVEQFECIREPLLRALFTPFPPVSAGLAVARQLGTAELLRFLRFVVQPVRRAGEESFAGEGAPLLLAGNALHTDLAPETAGSAVYGWLLAMLGQTIGFPVPHGGSGMITEALLQRLHAAGGRVRTTAPVERIEVIDRKVHAVRIAGGERVRVGTVLADVSAPDLFGRLVDAQQLPDRLLADLHRFQWDAPTLKLDWALSARIPWTATPARAAGTVHLGVDMNGLTRYAASLAVKEMPEHPFVLLGQMTTADPSRSPAGTESAWAYTHLPSGREITPSMVAEQVHRVEQAVEARAPGFLDTVAARSVQSPVDLQRADANLTDGAVGGGTANLHQQLFFRPIPGLGRAETPIDGLYLASASAHPGGGVHGGPGANAARAALNRARWTGPLRRKLVAGLLGRIYR